MHSSIFSYNTFLLCIILFLHDIDLIYTQTSLLLCRFAYSSDRYIIVVRTYDYTAHDIIMIHLDVINRVGQWVEISGVRS